LIWAVSLLTIDLLTNSLTIAVLTNVFDFAFITKREASTPLAAKQRYTKIYFVENQLFPSLISLSLQTASHPNLFQQTRVRAST